MFKLLSLVERLSWTATGELAGVQDDVNAEIVCIQSVTAVALFKSKGGVSDAIRGSCDCFPREVSIRAPGPSWKGSSDQGWVLPVVWPFFLLSLSKFHWLPSLSFVIGSSVFYFCRTTVVWGAWLIVACLFILIDSFISESFISMLLIVLEYLVSVAVLL